MLTFLRALLVWFGAIAIATASVQTEQERVLVSGLLIVFYTIPALLLFILMQQVESALIRHDGAMLALGIGPALAALPYLQLLGPAGLCWLGIAVLRLTFRFWRAAAR